MGLRERKKQRTRETIARVALELFDRHGFDATTIPEIAEAADVSPRTVSAYFPAKEELVFPHQEDWFGQLEARLRERPAGETAPEALRGWIESNLPGWEDLEPELRVQRRVIAAHEGLTLYQRRFLARANEMMAEAIARDLDRSPDDLEPRMAAAATTAILDVLGEHRDNTTSAADDPAAWHAEALALVDRAMLFVDAGVRALRAGDHT